PFFPEQTLAEVRDELMNAPVRWLQAHAQQAVTPIQEFPSCRDLPKRLVDGLHAALDKDPLQRPYDAGVFANLLGTALHYDFGIPVAAMLRIRHPNRSDEEQPIFPGSYRLGSGPRCEIQLSDLVGKVRRIHAVLE